MATLHLPALPPDDAENPLVLLDEHAYVAYRRNATTASSTTWEEYNIYQAADMSASLCI
jgi:hypothetical protein